MDLDRTIVLTTIKPLIEVFENPSKTSIDGFKYIYRAISLIEGLKYSSLPFFCSLNFYAVFTRPEIFLICTLRGEIHTNKFINESSLDWHIIHIVWSSYDIFLKIFFSNLLLKTMSTTSKQRQRKIDNIKPDNQNF